MGEDRVRRLSGWGRTTWARAVVHDATDAAGASALLRTLGDRGLLARGLGRSYGDAALNDSGHLLGPIAPRAPIEVDTESGTVRVSAGTSLDRLRQVLAAAGWRLPVLPGTAQVSVGGAVAADVHGKSHHVDGSFGSWVDSLELVDGQGERRFLSPSEDPQAFWATVGGMGLTGVITRAVLRVAPGAGDRVRVCTTRFAELDDALDAMERSAAQHHVAWVDTSSPRTFGRCILDEGDLDAARDVPRSAPAGGTRWRPGLPPLPVNVVRPAAIRAFNALWWNRAGEGERVVPTARFLFPLDGLRGWNRLYGPRGLLQWQVAVPAGDRWLVGHALAALARAGAVPALVVVKRFGAPNPAPLSFPLDGWTVAVDVAAGHPRVRWILDELDDQVADAGGRVYLAKDARARPATVARMYPRLPEWREVRARLDPAGRIRSDLARRLALS